MHDRADELRSVLRDDRARRIDRHHADARRQVGDLASSQRNLAIDRRLFGLDQCLFRHQDILLAGEQKLVRRALEVGVERRNASSI
jgi:hypothetical protein